MVSDAVSMEILKKITVRNFIVVATMCTIIGVIFYALGNYGTIAEAWQKYPEFGGQLNVAIGAIISIIGMYALFYFKKSGPSGGTPPAPASTTE